MLESEELKELVVSALEDRKGNDITVLDVKTLTDITDNMVLAVRSARWPRTWCCARKRPAENHWVPKA